MLDEVVALFHQPLAGAFIANAHLPITWQISPLRSFQESIAVLIGQDGKIFTAQVDVLDTVPIDLEFVPVELQQFRREFSLLRDKRVFSIKSAGKKLDYSFTPAFLSTKYFPTLTDYWDFLVENKPIKGLPMG